VTVRLDARTVSAPTGAVWRVRRRWLSRRLPRLRRVSGDAAGEVASQPGGWLPFDIGDVGDLEAWLVAIAALVLIIFVLVPVLLFGFELIIVGVLLATGIIGRLFLGRPWIIEANSSSGETLTWEVAGWRQSRHALDETARALAAGREPRIQQMRRRSRR
jgi:hypothetical protein